MNDCVKCGEKRNKGDQLFCESCRKRWQRYCVNHLVTENNYNENIIKFVGDSCKANSIDYSHKESINKLSTSTSLIDRLNNTNIEISGTEEEQKEAALFLISRLMDQFNIDKEEIKEW